MSSLSQDIQSLGLDDHHSTARGSFVCQETNGNYFETEYSTAALALSSAAVLDDVVLTAALYHPSMLPAVIRF